MGGASAQVRPRTSAFTFRVLGPLEVFADGSTVAIVPGRQEVVLAGLLLEAGRVLSSEHLVRLLWDEDPPGTARTQVQICMSRVRKLLSAADIQARIVTRAPGYLLQTDPDTLDLTAFRHMVAEARTLVAERRTDEAVGKLRTAVGLWRGPCLNGIPSRVLERVAQQIDEERLAAMETFLQLELDLGRHHQLIAEIGRQVDENPLRERFRSQLMLALYRSGRQAEALEVYRKGRALLQEELGLEPSENLRLLERAILTDAPELRLPTPAVTAPARGFGDASPGVVTVAAPAEGSDSEEPLRPLVPRQLPVDTEDFVGHGDLVETVESILGSTSANRVMGIVVIVGRPGIGKSTFANRVAHRLSESHFPDGQLYCDLRGARPDPVEPREVLGRFLRALGIPGPLIPDSLDERAEMYRSLLADRRMLVVLDSAASEAQVLPLLPGAKTCGVLITSRTRLTALPGAHRVALDILQTDESLELIANVIGHQRVQKEHEAARSLARAVGGLPLALRIVAARMAARPHWSLASMVERLADERRRLDELTHGEMTVRTGLSMTYDGLGDQDRRLLRLLSLAQGSTIPSWVAGALLDNPYPYPSDLLDPLVDVQMLDVAGVERSGELRYRFHDIIGLFAREQLTAESDGTERREAVRRLGGGWLALAGQANRLLFGSDYLLGTASRWHPPQSHVQTLLADPADWMDSERENLSLTVEFLAMEDEDEYAWELAVSLVSFYEARGYLDHWARTHRKALGAARRRDNKRGQAALLGSLGTLHLNRRHLRESGAALSRSLALFEELADSKGRALCLRDLAFLERIKGNDDRALELYERAVRDFDRSEDPVGRASVLTQSADILLRRGEIDRVERQLREALEIHRSAGYTGGQARALQRVGQVHLRRGQLAEAHDVLAGVLNMVVDTGDVIGEGHLLHDLGRVSARMGQADDALSFYGRALSLRERILDHTGVAVVRLDMAALLLESGRTALAGELLAEARDTFDRTDMVRELRYAETLMARMGVLSGEERTTAAMGAVCDDASSTVGPATPEAG